MVSNVTGGTPQCLVILSTVIDEAGSGDGYERVELDGVGLSWDGDDGHHESSPTGVVEYFELLEGIEGEGGYGVEWLRCGRDEVGVFAIEHKIVASNEGGLIDCSLQRF
jgi:hypothetical protein